MSSGYMLFCLFMHFQGFPGGSDSKEPTCQYRRPSFDPWVGKMPWRRKWQPTPVFWPGESHGQTSLAGYSPWGPKESNPNEVIYHACMHFESPQWMVNRHLLS